MIQHKTIMELSAELDDHEKSDYMTPAEIEVTCHLLGLSPTRLAEYIGVHRQTLKAWREGFRSPGPYHVSLMRELRRWHDSEVENLVTEAVGSGVITLPAPTVDGWSIGILSRVLDQVPSAEVRWLT